MPLAAPVTTATLPFRFVFSDDIQNLHAVDEQ
jgi:hypothetical protein